MPSACSSPRASRSEVRLTCSCSHKSRSTNRAPGSRTPVSIALRSDWMILLRSDVDGCWSDAKRPLTAESIVMEVAVSSRGTMGTVPRARLRRRRSKGSSTSGNVLFIGTCLTKVVEGPPCQNTNEIGAILPAAIEVAQQQAWVDLVRNDGCGAEVLLQRALHVVRPKDA
jgi:hypothetical protein